ncbi:MAG TPA: DedA family protein [Gemmatimonadaceae bacterium]|nr:DedA family protein [Gemmatimonadaceae bacterium]
MDALFAWLSALPTAVLYLALAAAAAVENIFPPFPADTVVAFGSFLAARGHAGFVGAFLAAWLGNVAGAMMVYGIARGAGGALRTTRFVPRPGSDSARRLRAFYERRGLIALAISRFVPGVRALVPPVAGALEVPAASFAFVIAAASALWYGIVTIAAYRLAANWSAVQAFIASFTLGTEIVAGVAAVIALMGWWLWRRRGARRERRMAERS